jgi:hypothetical protein
MNKFELSPDDIKAWWDALPDEGKTTSSGQLISLEYAAGGIFVGAKSSDDPWDFFEKSHRGMEKLLDHLEQFGITVSEFQRVRATELLDSLKDLGIEITPLHGDDFIAEAPEVSDEQIDATDERVDEPTSDRQREDDVCWEAVRDRIAAGKRQESAWPKWLGVAAGVICVGLATRLVRGRY